MQLAQEHHLSLEVEHEEFDDKTRRQMRSDFTIKAAGPPRLIEKHREAIIRFAQSFELIHEIPALQ
jgi:hypothetical protein